MKFWEIF